MTDKQSVTQKDLDLVAHLDTDAAIEGDADAAATDNANDADGGANDADVKNAGEKSDRKTSVLDGIDDIDDGDDGDKKATKEEDGKADDAEAKDDDADDGKAKDEKSVDDADDDEKADDEDWRVSLTTRLLRGKEDTLTASELKKTKKSIEKLLSRYRSQEDYLVAGFMAQEKIRSGEYKSGHPGEDASEKELAAWRKANGIPAKADAYELPEVKGYDWGQNEEGVGSFFRTAFDADLTQAQLDKLARWQAAESQRAEEAMEERMEEQDAADRESSHDDWRTRFGIGELKPSLKQMQRVLEDDELLPDGRGKLIQQARYYDPELGVWRLLINDPYVAGLFKTLGDYEFGEGAYLPSTEVVKSQGRIEELEALRVKDYNEFMRPGANGKSPSDELLDLRRKEEARENRSSGRRAA